MKEPENKNVPSMDTEIDLEGIGNKIAGGTHAYTRCKNCGRPHSVLTEYGICRICYRELAYKGKVPGDKKDSW